MADHWLFLIPLGFVCGIFSATFGVGAGILLIPVLVIGLALPQKVAQGTALAVMVPMALVGAWRYKADPSIPLDLWRVLFLALGSVFGAWFGQLIASNLSALVLRRAFAVILILAATRLLLTGPGKTSKALDNASRGGDVPAAVEGNDGRRD